MPLTLARHTLVHFYNNDRGVLLKGRRYPQTGSSCLIATVGLVMALAGLPTAIAQRSPVPRRMVTGGSQPADSAKGAAAYGRMPMSFEVNTGQTDSSVRFLTHGVGYGLYLTGKEAVLALGKPVCSGPPAASSLASKSTSRKQGDSPAPVPCQHSAAVLRMQLSGASHTASSPTGQDRLPGVVNYFVGDDPKKWQSNIPTFGKVRYDGVYSGVDVVYYGNQRQLEYDFVVAPGADANAIRLHFAGADRVDMGTEGDLSIGVDKGFVTLHKPVVYQTIEGRREAVAGSFEIAADRTVGFKLGTYDHREPLVIDPVLVYSTFLGGGYGPDDTYMSNASDTPQAIAVDAAGNTYVAGTTLSTQFPVTANALQSANGSGALGGSNAFISKINSSGTALVFSTYLGGSGTLVGSTMLGGLDGAAAIAVDGLGNIYVAGTAQSPNFPVTGGAFQTTNHQVSPLTCGPTFAYTESGPPTNAFVAKLGPAGNSLLYSTYLGGSGRWIDANGTCQPKGDSASGLAIDTSGNAYVTGTTFSFDFPVSGSPAQATNLSYTNDGSNAFVTKLNATGSALVYSTYLGGSAGMPLIEIGGDGANALAIDSQGNAYVTGSTTSADFPVTSGAFQTKSPSAGGLFTVGSAFVTKLNPAGGAIVYSTLLGGTGSGIPISTFYFGDAGFAIAVDDAGQAYVAGEASSDDFPVTPGAFQTVNKTQSTTEGGNAFVTKLNATGTSLVYSTYLGGSTGGIPGVISSNLFITGDAVLGLAIDRSGDAYVTGIATSPDFPTTPGAFQTANPGCICGANPGTFVAELNPAGKSLIYSSYLGGSSYRQVANALALDSAGNVHVAGTTASTDFPVTMGALQTQSTFYTGFVSELNLAATSVTPSIAISPAIAQISSAQASTLTVTVTSPGGPVPTGKVSLKFYSGSLFTTTATLSNGVGTLNLPAGAIPVGAYCAVVSYTPDTASYAYYNYALQSSTLYVDDIPVTITTNPVGLIVIVDGSATRTPDYTVWAPGSSHTIDIGSSYDQQSSGNAVYLFNSWSNGGAERQTITASSATTAYTANFTVTGYYLYTSAAPFGTGTVTPGSRLEPAGSVVSLSATPNAGYMFQNWTGNVANPNSANTTVVMNSSQTVAANFIPIVTTLSLSPTSLNFLSPPGVAASQTITVTNTGTATVSISGLAIAGANASAFSGTSTCASALAGGASCAITVKFTPTAATTYAATLTITDSGVGSPQMVPLSGTGAASFVSLSPGILGFASTVGTTTNGQAVTIGSKGTVPLLIQNITVTGANPAAFATSSNCSLNTPVSPPYENCQFVVYFLPSTVGSFTASITITDNAPDSPQTVTLKGTASAAPVTTVSITPAQLSFTAVNGTTSAPQTAILRNTGTAALAISQIALGATSPSTYAETDNCGTLLAPGATCAIQVTFSANYVGAQSNGLNVNGNGLPSISQVQLFGVGTAAPTPALTPTPTALAFTAAANATSAAQPVVLQNTGTAPLSIAGIAIMGAGAPNFPQTNTCGSTLAVGATCTVMVRFAPSAAIGYSAMIAITDNAPDSPQVVAVTGIASPATTPMASLMPAVLSFTAVSGVTSSAQVATLSNTGNVALSVGTVTLGGANSSSFAVTGNTCGVTLAVGSSCAISLTFTPGSVASFGATLTVSDSAGSSPQTVALSGTGTAPATPLASLTPGPLVFTSTVGTSSAAQIAILSNTGTAPLTISGLSLTGSNPSAFAMASTCGATLAASATCMISLTFTPPAAGTFSAALTIADNAAGSPQTLPLSGTGTIAAAPAATLSVTSLAFTATSGTSSVAQSVTLQNTGNAALTIGGISLGGSGASAFATSNSCGVSLAPNASCTASVTFTPSSAATFSASLLFADNAVGAPQTVALTGTGLALPSFTVSSPTGPQTVSSGGMAVYSISVTPINGAYNSVVSFSASGLPAGATATFSPASVTPGSAATSTTLTIGNIQRAAISDLMSRRSIPILAFVGLGLLLPRRRRRWPSLMLALLALVASVPLFAGCGGGATASSTSYTVTVTAVSGAAQQTTTVSLTVQ